MSELSAKQCIPCSGGVPSLTPEKIEPLKGQLHNDWSVVKNHHLERELKFPDFVTALAFVNKLGDLAEGEGHHPDVFLAWGQVKITLFTHKVDGLTESDFVFAAKADDLIAEEAAING
jgi:4a-hydroxytetrahydrobiopterin dehydratase